MPSSSPTNPGGASAEFFDPLQNGNLPPMLLIQLNRRGLPPAIHVKGPRLAMLVVAALFYGFFSGWLVIVQIQNYLAQS